MRMNKRFIIALAASILIHVVLILLLRTPEGGPEKEPIYVDIVDKQTETARTKQAENPVSSEEDRNRQAGDRRTDGQVAQTEPQPNAPVEPEEPERPAPDVQPPNVPEPEPPRRPQPDEPNSEEPFVPQPRTPQPNVPELPKPNVPLTPKDPGPDEPRQPVPDEPSPPVPPDDDRVARVLDPSKVIRDQIARNEQASGEGEDSVTIETMKFRYASYFHKFSRRLYQVWKYPAEAGMRGESGVTRIGFSILADGTVTNIRVVSSSGYPDLDRAAVRALKEMAGVPLPESYNLDILNITGQFVYLNMGNSPYVN